MIDVLVEDEARPLLSQKILVVFPGSSKKLRENDQRILVISFQDRRAVYSTRSVIETLADEGSMLELRPKFGLSMVTAY